VKRSKWLGAATVMALALTLVGCSPEKEAAPAPAVSSSANGGQDPEVLPPLPTLKNVPIVAQDTASLPTGRIGEPYDAIPPCEIVDWDLVYKVIGSEFEYKEGYNAPYESRDCSSVDAGTINGQPVSLGQTMVTSTRVDRRGPSPLYDQLKAGMKQTGTMEPYTHDDKTKGVMDCFWIKGYTPGSPDTNNGMACRDLNNVTLTFTFQNGFSRADSVKLMAHMLGYARAYAQRYYTR